MWNPDLRIQILEHCLNKDIVKLTKLDLNPGLNVPYKMNIQLNNTQFLHPCCMSQNPDHSLPCVQYLSNMAKSVTV